jgi:hypothetical protein
LENAFPTASHRSALVVAKRWTPAFPRVIDRNQKGTLWLRLEEGAIEQAQLTRLQRLILHKLRTEHKTFAQIARDLRMSPATVKKD